MLWDPEEVQAEDLSEDGPNNLEDREDAGDTLEATERLARMVGSTLEKREEEEAVVAFFSIGNDGSEKACPWPHNTFPVYSLRNNWINLTLVAMRK